MAIDLKADRTLDCKGLLCPMPLIKVSKAIKEIQVGQILEVLATDPGSQPDIQAWTRQTGHELLGFDEENGLFRFWVRRTK